MTCRPCARGRSSARDFERFDLVLAMDRSNLASLREQVPAYGRARVQLFLDYAPGSEHREMPDP